MYGLVPPIHFSPVAGVVPCFQFLFHWGCLMRKVLFLSLVLASSSTWALNIGAAAPDFSLTGTDGKEYGLAKSLKENDAAIVIFVATKCPYSNAYNERYNDMIATFKKKAPKKVAFLAINSNMTEPMEEVKAHAAEKKFTFPVLKDDNYKVADLYSAEKTPEAFLVGKNGKVLYHGRIDDDSEGKNIKSRDLMAAIDQVLAGKEVKVKETRSFGCSIKRK